MHKSNKNFKKTFNKKGKIYHSCMNRSKNASRKLIEFKRGEFCIFPSSKLYWKKELNTKHLTRQGAKEIKQKYR